MERADVRTLVGGGAVLGMLTALGVAAFSVLSRATTGTTESVGQIVLVLLGASVCAFFPALRVRPRSTDFIAWAALLGLLGALFFTVADAVLLRRVGVYHWTWDAIGGGSGMWYIPVWWMGAAVLAWLGAWIVTISAPDAMLIKVAGLTVVIALVLAAIMIVTDVGSLHPATAALAFMLALPVHVAIAKVTRVK
jgi:hypothetical protein